MLAFFWSIGYQTEEHALGLGSTAEVTPEYGRFLAHWTWFGGWAAIALALAFHRWLTPERRARWRRAWEAVSDRRWMIYGSLLAFAIPAVLRRYLVLDIHLTDDEQAYRFMAQVLASGRLFADSPPMKVFFDHRMMVNDGKVYAQYFLGWPALMVPGAWLQLTGYMNGLYSGCTVPALFGIVRRLAGSGWARLTLALFLGSPMLMVGAATELSHTSCLMALTWLLWWCLRSREDDAPRWSHAAVAAFFSLAFFIRPLTALGLGGPVLVGWLAGLRRLSGRRRSAALASFLAPALIMAALFLGVQKAQTGSFFETAYERTYAYAQENHFLFSQWSFRRPGGGETLGPPNLQVLGWRSAMAWIASGIFRFGYALSGWPLGLVFLFFTAAGGPGRAPVRTLWSCILAFLFLNLFVQGAGIDLFGPLHYFELALPALVLGTLGMRRLGEWLAGHGIDGGRAFPALLAASLTLVSLLVYVPLRFRAIHEVARTTRRPIDRLAEMKIDHGVVFAPHLWIHPRVTDCPTGARSPGWVVARPNNDPRLENDILWVNHLSQEADMELMRDSFPDRRGYSMWWADCEVHVAPLEQVRVAPAPEMKVLVEKGIVSKGEHG